MRSIHRTFRFSIKDLGGQLPELDLRSIVLQLSQRLFRTRSHTCPRQTLTGSRNFSKSLAKLPRVALSDKQPELSVPVSLHLGLSAPCSEWCPWSPLHARIPTAHREQFESVRDLGLDPINDLRNNQNGKKLNSFQARTSCTGLRRWAASWTASKAVVSATRYFAFK